jgi:hypothetical protein
MNRLLLSVFLLAAASRATFAYEEPTHEVLTDAAVTRSVIVTDPTVLEDLGLTAANAFPNSKSQKRTIPELIRDGSNFEDNVPDELRVRWHFYNPVTGNGASTPVVPAQISSPSWALMPRGAHADQQFSYWDARHHLFDALTLSTATERDSAYGRSFQILGSMVHHLQDMAQPQHVRNDAHCKYIKCLVIGAYAPSLYEAWTNREEVRPTLPRDPATVGYDVNSSAFKNAFDTPRRFWHTEAPGGLSAALGKGMAEFTNRNFVSAGTNYWLSFADLQPNENFALPNPTGVDLVREAVSVVNMRTGQTMNGEMWFVPNVVRDNFLDTTDVNVRGSTYSLFDDDLTRTGRRPLFALNRLNFEAAYPYLLPRAVAYSAGMINYFLRGRIDLKKDGQDPSKFRVANLSNELMSGRFALYYDANDGKRYPVAVDPNDPSRDPNDPNAWRLLIAPRDPANPNVNLSEPIAFVPPVSDGSPTSPKSANEYMLVFRGNLGQEREDPSLGIPGAVAAKMVAAPYNSVLYILAADAANQRIAIRVDKTGTRVVPSSEFHPLRNITIPAAIGSVLPKAYASKQVRFTQSTFGYSYETLAATVGIHFPFYGAFTTGWSKNPASGAYESVAGPVWTAKSSDPAIGEFLFRPIVPESNPSGSALAYRRTFLDSSGAAQTTTGIIPMPPPPEGDFSQYFLLAQGGSVISGDGLSIGGFTKVVDRFANPTMQEQHDLRITLDAAPTLSFVKTGELVISDIRAGPTIPLTTTQIGTVDVQLACIPMVTLAVNRSEYADERTINNADLRLIDYYDGALRSYKRVDSTHSFIRYVASGANIQGGPCSWIYLQAQGEAVDGNDMDGSIAFSAGGTLVTSMRSNESGFSRMNLGAFNRRWNYPTYLGPYPTPPIQYESLERPATFTLYSNIQPVGPLARDAVHTLNTTGAPAVTRFRANDITGKAFVADASPIGEVFFATTDLSLVVHEPRRGAQVNFPPNVVKLLAAIWM